MPWNGRTTSRTKQTPPWGDKKLQFRPWLLDTLGIFLQVFAHTGALSLLFSRRDIHRSKVSSNFIKTCSQIHSEFGGTFTELKNPQDILGNKLPPLWAFCFPKCHESFYFFLWDLTGTCQIPAGYHGKRNWKSLIFMLCNTFGHEYCWNHTHFTIDSHHNGVPHHRFQWQSGTHRWPQV
jgi:hypothetical protein